MAAAGVLAIALLIAPIPGLAQDKVFTVDDVAVDVTAQSASAARELAIAEGHRKAYERLIDRLVPSGDQGSAPALDADRIAELVSGFEVANEKTSDVRYLASLRFDFSPEAVRRLLREAGVPFAETRSKTVLVLPVLRRAGALLLWDSVNDWHKAWASLPPADGLVPMVVPAGDLADIASIGPEQALAGEEARINAIARRYGASDALLAYAVLSYNGASGRASLQVTATRFGAAASERTIVQRFEAAAGEDPRALMDRAAAVIRTEVEENWKRDNVLRFDERRRLIAVAPVSGIAEWIMLRQRLEDVAFVEKSELLTLSRGEAKLRLSYLGDEEQLALALAQRDLSLRRGPISWELRLRNPSGADGPPAEAR